MADTSLTDDQESDQPADVSDLRLVPLAELPGDIDGDDMVNRILGRQRYAWRVDVAAFGNFI